MQGILMVRKVGVSVLAAAALAGAAAGPADAAIWGPGCTATLAPVATTASCGFDSPTDYSTIRVTPQGTVTATVRCTSQGYTTSWSRTVSTNTSWAWSTRGTCSLILTAVTAGATANGSATPTVGPIIEPPPPTS
jgi:hypothetical protein